jgi:hypothetical protein
MIRILRTALAVLALTTVVVFLAEINSPRNDAVYLGQAAFVLFLVQLGVILRRRRNS